MHTIFTIHSHLRWLVVGVLLIALIKLLITWMRRSDFSGLDRGLLSAAIGMIDLQVVLGLVLMFGLDGGFPRPRVEHGFTMVLAAVCVHLTARWKRADSITRARNSYVLLLLAALLIFIAVMRLPGGWARGM